MKKILLVLLLAIFLSTGCSNESKEPVEDTTVIEETTEKSVVEEPTEDLAQEPEPVQVKEGKPSPLSGIYGKDEIVNQRVVAVMFDNHPSARWQAGLKDAEIVYEIPVEAPYTRYIGLYLLNSPESIGPIRSARPYFVTKVLEFDAVYARVGGSEQAKSDIRKLGIADIDGLTSSSTVFWRKSSKKAPHNLYSSMEVLREAQTQRGYKLSGDYEGFKFNEEDTEIEGKPANSVFINYMSGNTTKYIYDSSTKLYNREKDGKVHIDESDKSVITAKNIIIQDVIIKVIDKEGRLSVALEGEGSGIFISNGAAKNLTWKKSSRKSKTYYYDESGQEIYFNPGHTWVQLVGAKTTVNIE